MINLKEDFEFEDIQLLNFVNLTDNEKQLVRSWRNNENIRKWMRSRDLISPDEHIEFINRLKNDEKNFYWAAKQKNKEYLGVIYLNKVDRENRNAYLGIYVNPASEISGKGKLLIQCLKHIAFKISNLYTLKLEVMDSNERAKIFYKKYGFLEEGVLRSFIFKDNKWVDIIIMGVMNNEKK
jgi:UDP-4-amino-4,6-dideoxy-N-acetyl-beta-L-altrosamine N-acetyltransferase